MIWNVFPLSHRRRISYALPRPTVGQFRLVSFWFRNKELSMAFGTQIAVSRLGSVLNFLLTENFAEHFGIVWALWGGGQSLTLKTSNVSDLHSHFGNYLKRCWYMCMEIQQAVHNYWVTNCFRCYLVCYWVHISCGCESAGPTRVEKTRGGGGYQDPIQASGELHH